MRALWLALLLVGCSGGSSSGGSSGGGSSSGGLPDAPNAPTEFAFSGPTQDDLARVRSAWEARDLSSKDVQVALQDDEAAGYDVTVYRHSVGASTHFGVVSIPEASNGTRFPVLVFADGLDQSNPSMNGETVLGYFSSILNRAVVVIPTFRGRTLIYKGRSFPADGDFCDAYDGAADDTIALLNVVQETTPEADLDRVLVRGGSRGGNTALLMGVRDERVDIVDATAAPVDFYREEVRNRYGSQYTCQFVTGKTPDQSRERMLASSPLHFAMLASVEQVYLYQGTDDPIVPLWNAQEMNAHLSSQGVEVQYRSYDGIAHIDIYQVSEYQQAQHETMEAFLLRPD